MRSRLVGATHVSQQLHSTRGALKRDFPEIGFGRARFKPYCNMAVVLLCCPCPNRRSVCLMPARDPPTHQTIARTSIDRSAVDVRGDPQLTNAIRDRPARRLAS